MAWRAGVCGSGCGGPEFSGSRGCFRSLTSLHRLFGGRVTVSLYSKPGLGFRVWRSWRVSLMSSVAMLVHYHQVVR